MIYGPLSWPSYLSYIEIVKPIVTFKQEKCRPYSGATAPITPFMPRPTILAHTHAMSGYQIPRESPKPLTSIPTQTVDRNAVKCYNPHESLFEEEWGYYIESSNPWTQPSASMISLYIDLFNTLFLLVACNYLNCYCTLYSLAATKILF